MDYYPVFSYFDVYLNYDNHKIEKNTKYLVKMHEETVETKILFGARYAICYGNKLMKIKGIEYEILYFRRPSRLVKSNAKQLISNLYKTKLSDDEKEDIREFLWHIFNGAYFGA